MERKLQVYNRIATTMQVFDGNSRYTKILKINKGNLANAIFDMLQSLELLYMNGEYKNDYIYNNMILQYVFELRDLLKLY